MTARAVPLRAAIGLMALLRAATSLAQPFPAADLLQPSDLFQVSASPSGARVAALKNDHGRVTLLVSQWQANQLRPAVSSYYLGRYQSVIDYRWLNDDYLYVRLEDLVAGWQIPVVAGIPDDTWRPLPVFTELLQYPWGDPQHALLQESSHACRTREMSFCLFSLNVGHWGGQQISAPLSLLPVQFLVTSPAEIYVRGRNYSNRYEEARLDSRQRWEKVPEGTFARQSASLKESQQLPAATIAAAAQAGIDHPMLVRSYPSGRVVGIMGHAPQRAFVPLDARLDGLQQWLVAHYPSARVAISGLNDELSRGEVLVWGTNLPPTPFLMNAEGSLAQLQGSSPRIASDALARTSMQPAWVPGAAVAVSTPPRGVPLIGAVVIPVLAPADELQDPLYNYRPEVQAFAQQGVAVVQLLASIPDTFATAAEGAAWRSTFAAQLQAVAGHASQELLHGRPVCLYGERLAGELALVAATRDHIGCIAVVNAVLNPSELAQSAVTGLPVGYARLVFRYIGPTPQMLQQEFPAAFANDEKGFADPVRWIPRLPDHLMLGYEEDAFADPVRGYSAGEFAAGSGAFRAAARKAGKSVLFYAPAQRFAPLLQREVRMLDAATKYVHDYYASGPVAGP